VGVAARRPAPILVRMFHQIRFHSTDGTPLAGLYHPAGDDGGGPGAVVVHGLGSCKENHADFGEECARAGIAALALDVRGHGASGGRLDAGAVDDVLAATEWLAARGHGPLAVRGSSLGGFLALHAAARDPRVRAVVALCPARPEQLARKTETPWPLALPLGPSVARDDGVARGFWHAHGDEVVPWGSTFALAQMSPHPRRLHVAMGGHHRSLQHDPAVLRDTVAFLRAHLSAA